ncbi:hypothetical protein OG215_38450 (plasmid) [Streptomyces globisporus]|uniref:hypothetical protein n=1 Tax=Streptomyces globisporus TaxID=1908 RepID=UPI002F915FCF|nr:hypothetical protein OG215_38450 [Streptomyces globisporus]
MTPDDSLFDSPPGTPRPFNGLTVPSWQPPAQAPPGIAAFARAPLPNLGFPYSRASSRAPSTAGSEYDFLADALREDRGSTPTQGWMDVDMPASGGLGGPDFVRGRSVMDVDVFHAVHIPRVDAGTAPPPDLADVWNLPFHGATAPGLPWSRPGLSILTAKAHEGLARDLLDRLAHPDSQGVTYGQLHRYAAGKGYTLTAHDLNDLRSQTTPRAVAEAADEADPQQEHMGTGAASHGRSRERNAAALKVVFQQPGWAELGKVKAGGISPVTRLPKTGTQVELHGDTRLVNIGTRVSDLQKSGSKKVSPQEEAVLTLQGFTITEGKITGAASQERSHERNAAALKVVFQQPGWAELGKVKAGGISPVTRLPKTGTQVELHGDTRLVNIGTRVAKLQKSGTSKVSPQEEAVLTLQGFTIREGRLVRAGGIRSAVAPRPGAVTVPDVPVTPLRPRSSYQQPSGSEPVLRKETTRPRQNNDVLVMDDFGDGTMAGVPRVQQAYSSAGPGLSGRGGIQDFPSAPHFPSGVSASHHEGGPGVHAGGPSALRADPAAVGHADPRGFAPSAGWQAWPPGVAAAAMGTVPHWGERSGAASSSRHAPGQPHQGPYGPHRPYKQSNGQGQGRHR